MLYYKLRGILYMGIKPIFQKIKYLFVTDNKVNKTTKGSLVLEQMLKCYDEEDINEIDSIAVSKNRNVIFIEFNRNYYLDYKYEDFLSRNKLIKFLNENNIDFLPSLYAQKEHSWEMYKGQIYIDLEINKDDEKFKLLNNYVKEDNHIICTQYLLNDAIEHQKTKTDNYQDYIKDNNG